MTDRTAMTRRLSSHQPRAHRVVIVGGGFAGLRADGGHHPAVAARGYAFAQGTIDVRGFVSGAVKG
jgi:hypothetical protein